MANFWSGPFLSIDLNLLKHSLGFCFREYKYTQVCTCAPGMSGVSGTALWEVSCINRSLSALSDVLGALAEQRPHVPYRNSRLTHLLQDVIGDKHTHQHSFITHDSCSHDYNVFILLRDSKSPNTKSLKMLAEDLLEYIILHGHK